MEGTSVAGVEEMLDDSYFCRGRTGCRGVKLKEKKWEKSVIFDLAKNILSSYCVVGTIPSSGLQ